MHSATVAKLTKDDLIETIPPSEGKPAVRTFLGKPVVVDDSLPVEDGVYTTTSLALVPLDGVKVEHLYL